VQNYRKEEEGRGVLVNNNRIGGKRLDFTSRSGENSVLEQPGISRGTANDPVPCGLEGIIGSILSLVCEGGGGGGDLT
jgi:hypothetical protein